MLLVVKIVYRVTHFAMSADDGSLKLVAYLVTLKFYYLDVPIGNFDLTPASKPLKGCFRDDYQWVFLWNRLQWSGQVWPERQGFDTWTNCDQKG